jgi:alpha-galactosidase
MQPVTRHTFQSCEAEFDGRILRLANDHMERRWRIEGGRLYAESFYDKATKHEWIVRPAEVPSLYPPAKLDGEWKVEDVTMRDGVERPMEAAALLIDLSVTCGATRLTYKFKLFPAARGVAIRLVASGLPALSTPPELPATQPSGIESTTRPAIIGPVPDTVECFDIDPRHVSLTQVTLHDRTDVHDNLVFESTWQLSRAEPQISAVGNLFILEQRLTGRGLIVFKVAPLPHARPIKSTVDFRMLGQTCHVIGHGIGEDTGTGYPLAILSYEGGRPGRIAALQQFQRQLRVPDESRDGKLISNTWGDRSKDGRISEAFMRKELDAAQKLGIDVVQLDDGWQKGVSGNSVTPGGVWIGFWDRDPHFWDPHPTRFPNGLMPLAQDAHHRGLKLGLWFAPDSSNDFANWQRDANAMLNLHREHGVDNFKIDGVKMYTPAGERNLGRFVDAVLEGSGGKVVFDLDVTAAVRPGYFGLIRAGNVFVENRYTDWLRYFPHATLRNLWQLAQHVDPVRLRMEFLNHTRNANLYGDDPLAPARYRSDYLFASVMFASPLGWFEVSNLPNDYIDHVAPLIAMWKEHRAALHGGTIIPIGDAPDGTRWTGFASRGSDGGGYLLIFRELNDQSEVTIEVPFTGEKLTVTLLAGAGEVAVSHGRALVRIRESKQFVWVRLSVPKRRIARR